MLEEGSSLLREIVDARRFPRESAERMKITIARGNSNWEGDSSGAVCIR